MNRALFLRSIFCCCFVLLAMRAEAACSPYEGLASINEVNKEHPSGRPDADDFIEVKLLSTSIPASTYTGWEIEICSDSSPGCRTYSLGDFSDAGYPWLVLKGADANVLYDFANSFNIILRDANGDSIDFLYFDSDGQNDFRPLADSSCDFSFGNVASQSASGQGVKRIRRMPDGTGNWDSVTAQSDSPTEGETNDDDAFGGPELTVSDTTTLAGEDMAFTLTLSEAHGSDLTVDFRTQDGTATAGMDYTSSTGTLTIPAGTQTVSVSVSTLGSSQGGTFYLQLSGTGSDDPVITGQVGQGTIEVRELADFTVSTGGANASTCFPQEIGIAALNSDGEVMTDFDGTILLSTSSGNGAWSSTFEGSSTSDPPQGVLDPEGNDTGSASYTFSIADNGTVALFLGNARAETLSISIQDAGTGINRTSSNLTFRENALVVSVTDSLGDDVVAGREHRFRLAMLRRDPDLGDCSVAQDYGSSEIKGWVSRSGQDPNGTAPNIISDAGLQPLPSSEPASANISFPFVNGIAEFQLDTSDVGNYSLEFKDDSGDFSDQVLSGASSLLVIRPFGLHIDVVDNPAAADADGAVFAVAGQNFTVSVRAVGWSADDDSSGDGVPDGHDDTDPSNNADLSNNAILPSFGQEGLPANVVLSARLANPVGGADPGLSDGDELNSDGRVLDSFVNGSDTTSHVRYDEVGIIEVTASLMENDYLGAGAARAARVTGRSGYIGRFVPEDFLLSNVTISPFCEPGRAFTYMGQPLAVNYRLSARTLLGSAATNYRGEFVKFDLRDTNDDGNREALGSLGFGAVDNASIDLSDRLVPPLGSSGFMGASAISWTAGTGDVETSIVLERASAPDGPYINLALGVRVQDEDGVSTTPMDLDTTLDGNGDYGRLGDTRAYFGRLRLNDAYGPEVVNLPVQFFTEYWSGTEFVRNVDDSCTRIPREAINYPEGNLVDDGNRTVAIGGGETTGEYQSLDGVGVNFFSSDANHRFTAPGQGNIGTFEVQIDLSERPWLRYDWNQDGNYNDVLMPPARFGFGSYRGHDRIIYWREVLE